MIEERILNQLKEMGISDIREYEESGATDTSENAAKTLNVPVGAIAKSILVTTKNINFFMIVASGDKKLSSPKMKEYFKTKTSFASLDDTLRLTGYSFGGVCPFAISSDIEIIIDKSLSRYEYLYVACGSNRSLAKVTIDNLLSLSKTKLEDLTID